MFEGKIPNYSKVIAFTKNHTDDADEDDDNDGTINPPVRGRNYELSI